MFSFGSYIVFKFVSSCLRVLFFVQEYSLHEVGVPCVNLTLFYALLSFKGSQLAGHARTEIGRGNVVLVVTEREPPSTASRRRTGGANSRKIAVRHTSMACRTPEGFKAQPPTSVVSFTWGSGV